VDAMPVLSAVLCRARRAVDRPAGRPPEMTCSGAGAWQRVGALRNLAGSQRFGHRDGGAQQRFPPSPAGGRMQLAAATVLVACGARGGLSRASVPS
jgi:hypothetical protein